MVCNHCGIDNEAGEGETCRGCGASLLEREVRRGTVDVVYAGFQKRALAVIIDSLILFVIGTIIGVAYLVFTGTEEGVEAASNVAGVIIGWLYFASMESGPHQATFGKRALGIIVTDMNGKRLSFYRASGRHFGKIVSSVTLGFGFLMVLFTEKSQTLHDKMFDCLVVCKKS